MDEKKVIIAYHKRRKARLDNMDAPRKDGGPGSGNWGHVGRIGLRGGSEPGGGNAYRITKEKVKNPAKKFTSLSKVQRKLSADYKEAKANGWFTVQADLESTMRDMRGGEKGKELNALIHKSAWNMERYRSVYGAPPPKTASARAAYKLASGAHSVQSINKTASKDIQRDKERGAKSYLRKHVNGTTTKENRQRMYKKGSF